MKLGHTRRGSFRTFLVVVSMSALTVLSAAHLSARTFHLKLDRAEPAADSTITKAPTELRLFFSEQVKASLTSVRLIGPDSAIVALDSLHVAAPSATSRVQPVVATVKGQLRSGKHRVLWRTQGTDGHVLNGEYAFTLRLTNGAGGDGR